MALAAVVLHVLLVPDVERWAPLALAVGPLLAAVAVRQAVLRPLARQEHAAERASVPV